MLRRLALAFGTATLVIVAVGVAWLSLLVSHDDQRHDRPAAARTNSYTSITQYGSDAVYSQFAVPQRYRRVVSTSEPMWARLVDRDRNEARRMLLEHIGKLRQKAPIEPGERKDADLPKFGVRADEPGVRAVRDQVALLLSNPRYDAKLARQIVAKGPLGLAMCAEKMASLEYQDRRDFESAKRLQRLLVQATTCRDLELVSTTSASKARAYNRPLGHLWGWFVNEFAHSERTWQAYRQLFRL